LVSRVWRASLLSRLLPSWLTWSMDSFCVNVTSLNHLELTLIQSRSSSQWTRSRRQLSSGRPSRKSPKYFRLCLTVCRVSFTQAATNMPKSTYGAMKCFGTS
jgi:hypothetical protein